MGTDTNLVVVTGRLTRDCELKYTNTGIPLIRGSIAVNKSYKSNGQFVDKTSFFNMTLWPIAEYADKKRDQLYKGRMITVTGELEQNRWTDNDGQNRSVVSILARSIQYLSSRKNSSQNQQGPPQTEYQGGEDQSGYPEYGDGEDDIPF